MRISTWIQKYKDMSQPVKASFWFTVCNILNKGIALISTPVFVRILTTDEYGDYSVFQSWYSILVIFATLNLFSGEYGKGLIEFDDDKDRFTSSVLGLTSVITLLVFAVFACNLTFWSGKLSLSPILIIALFVEIFTMSAYEFWSTKQRFEYKYKKVVLSTLGMSVGSILLGIISVLATDNYKLEARVFSDVFVKAVISLVAFFVIVRNGKKLFDKKYWKYALLFNLPLIPHFLSTMVLSQSDRIMIKDMVGSSAAAVYSIAYTIGTMVLLITNAINNSFTPYTYQALKDKEYDGIKKNATLLCVLVAVLVILSMAFAPEIILIFGGSKYYEAIWVVPPVAVSMFLIFLYSLFSNIEYYFKKTGFIALASIVCAVANLGLNKVFIELFGYYAAGYTTLVCYGLLALMHYFFYRKALHQEGVRASEVYNLKQLLLILAAVLCVMFVMTFTYRHIVIRYAIVAVILAVMFVNRKKIIGWLKNIRNS